MIQWTGTVPVQRPSGKCPLSLRTCLCRVTGGEPQPGIEPEVDSAEHVAIAEVRGSNVRDPDSWDPLVIGDPFTHLLLQRLITVLGYAENESRPND